MDTKERIDLALFIARSSISEQGSYAYLPDIIKTLEAISDCYSRGDVVGYRKLAAGLGRLVSEDYGFMESEFGGKLSDIVTELSR